MHIHLSKKPPPISINRHLWERLAPLEGQYGDKSPLDLPGAPMQGRWMRPAGKQKKQMEIMFFLVYFGIFLLTQPLNHEMKVLNLIFPTKYMLAPRSLKVGQCLSKF